MAKKAIKATAAVKASKATKKKTESKIANGKSSNVVPTTNIGIPNGRSVKISNFSQIFRKFSQNFRSYCQFLRFAVHSKVFEKIDLVAAIFWVLKS